MFATMQQNGIKLEVSDRDNENFQICDLLHNTGFKEKISGTPKNILKENATYKNSQSDVKAEIRGEFVALIAYTIEEENLQSSV